MIVGEFSLGAPILTVNESGRHVLVGSRCPACGDVRLPSRTLCGADLSECVPHELSGEGTVYEAVRIALAPAGFEAPFWIGYVDLAEGPRYFAQIEAPEDAPPSHGDRVTLTVGRLGTSEEPLLGPIFRKVTDAH
ncbi:OB-fold domain-containing protein [Dactylosporangium sp. NPDC051484]|uniref:Zn-ribbon domain-containing OB-fold protein n=1 Tax=Dactylosporangium sp. NPDC051484 TaxID=3154942 RepID=UPI00344EDC63